MKIAILFDILNFQGTAYRVGGIQTYVLRLAGLCFDKEWQVKLFQTASHAFEKSYADITIQGIEVSESEWLNYNVFLDVTFAAAQKWICDEPGIIIVARGGIAYRYLPGKVITIQHGIVDALSHFQNGDSISKNPAERGEIYSRRKLLKWIKNTILWQVLRTLKYGHDPSALSNKYEIFDNTDFRVCVDYNYVNLHRSVKPLDPNKKTWVIPNCADIVEESLVRDRLTYEGNIRILFARRFTWVRGTRLTAAVFKRLLQSHPEITLTMAGEGEDENMLRDFFAGCSQVSFCRYEPAETTKVLLGHDIALVPSLGSEGTSFSVAEAMGAGCAVVASNVGGITNMLIDRFNGRLIMPDEESLHSALSELIANRNLLHILGMNGYETARHAFSEQVWREKWTEVLTEVSDGKP